MKLIDRQILALGTAFLMLFGVVSLTAQSTNQDYPTPITTNEISGTIKARDVGDARLTSYYYQFDGAQGDLFVNIVTRNLTGDIDIFTVNGLRPLTKIVVYADLAETETGRVLYFRKPERMILRVQGRTPGDEPAAFRIKFAGSFVASTQAASPPEPELPTLAARNESGIRVNSVGTIVEVIPKATPTPVGVETVSGIIDERSEVPEAEREKENKTPDQIAGAKTEEKANEASPDTSEKKMEVVVTETIPEKRETISPPLATRRTARGRRRTPPKTTPPTAAVEKPVMPEEGATTSPPATERRRRTTATLSQPKGPDPLENINLVIIFKDGTTLERPLSRVLRFTVDKGVLTVIAKDGSIGRYSMLDVAKVTIE